MNKERRNTITTFIIGLLSIVIFYSKIIPFRDQTVINFITVLGTYLSIFGLIVAYIQISSVKKIAKLTEEKVQETRDKIILILSVSDISKAIKVAEEAQFLLNNSKYDAALLRLKDLKSVIIQASMIPSLNTSNLTPDYHELKSNLVDDITNLSDFANGHKKKINFSVINSDLEKLSSILIEFENRLKTMQ